ncbi:MAG TPA: hypothetical protein VFK04_11470 [Gemmatimonadaceae bacterium]|jgi:hypothetical protein|nr:hypothetical protein [Gemmatimonadaceae bacterium]
MVVRLPPHDSVLVAILPTASHPCPEEACAVALQPFTSAPDTLLPQRTAVALWRLWRPRLDSTSVRMLVIATVTTPRAGTSGSAVKYGDGHFVFVRVADGHWQLLERPYAKETYRLVVDSLPP